MIDQNDYNSLVSEQANPRTVDIDAADTGTLLRMINDEDRTVPEAVARELPRIEEAVDLLYDALSRGGRMMYVGAGTSGRLGVLDASECPPTYGTPPEMVQAYIAGGDKALRRSVEGAEDDEAAGMDLMDACQVDEKTVVVGITASGSAPYVLGAVRRARERGAKTVAVVTNKDSRLSALADVSIEPVVGPEVIMGSTRMKSGTAQKLVLNMLTTAVMIRLGKVYRNMMVDLSAKNQKLYDRSLRMIMRITDASRERAAGALAQSDGELKTAIVILLCETDAPAARERLSRNGGRLRDALADLR